MLRLPTATAKRFRSALAFAVPLLLVVPFDPQWPDFERARRGVLLVLVGALLLGAGLRRRPAAPVAWLLGLAVLALVSALWAHDRLIAVEQGTYLIALFALPLVVRREDDLREPLLAGFAAALAITALYGLLQAQGWMWPRHYTVPHEPVSSLGNRNVAAEWTAVASPLALAAHPLLGWIPVAAADLYLWANGGRAGLIAFHVAVAAFVLLGRGAIDRARLGVFLVVFFGLAALLGKTVLAPAGHGTGAETARTVAAPAGDTVRVRLLLWSGALEMAADHTVAGVGAGNFRVDYPRYRAQEEIDISSFDHLTGTRVTTAHNDPLHLLAELGLLGAVLLGGFAWSLARAFRRGFLQPLALAGLAGFVPIALLRAPTFNAPAAAAVLVALALGWKRRDDAMPRAGPVRLAGLPMIALGSAILIGEHGGAEFFRAKRVNDPARGVAGLDRAVAADPFETDWRLLRAQVHHKRGATVPAEHLPQTLADLHGVLERRPCEYRALADTGYLGLKHPNVALGNAKLAERGREAVELLLRLDRKHPEGLFLASEYAFLAGNVQAGLKALELLGRKDAIVIKWRQMKALTRAETDRTKKIALGRVQLELKRLGRKLFPDADEFR